jgi:hypothetical protein
VKLLCSAAAVLLMTAASASAQMGDPRVAEALKPLPEDLKTAATVVAYDKTTGARQILKQGTNQIECQPKAEDGFVRCYNKVMAPRRDMEAKLHAEKKTDKEVSDAIAAAMKAGTLKPAPFGTISYRYSDDPQRIKLLWVVSVPNATPESLGVSTTSQRDAALAGHGMPWMMLPGTPGAHIMVPINGTPLSSGAK